MVIHAPQAIYLVITLLSAGYVIAMNSKDGNPYWWLRLISQGLFYGLLWWGGFFSAGCP